VFVRTCCSVYTRDKVSGVVPGVCVSETLLHVKVLVSLAQFSMEAP
jgi:hypothetical protein